MERILALDIGMRRTGVAYADSDTGVPFPLETIEHTTTDELIMKVLSTVSERRITHLVVGLPFLLSGAEGAQAKYVHSVVEELKRNGLFVELIDERYTTERSDVIDVDAKAACTILGVYIDKKK